MRRVFTISILAALALALVAPAAAGGGCRAATSEAKATTVLMELNCFGPTVARVAVGERVRFVNADSWGHTVTGAGLEWGSTAQLGPGQDLTHVFTAPGTYPYVCLLHPGMIGSVVVEAAASPAAPTVAAPAVLAADAAPPNVVVDGSPPIGWIVAAAVAGLATGWVGALVSRRSEQHGAAVTDP